MTLPLKPWGPSAIANQNTGPALGFLNIPQCHWAFPLQPLRIQGIQPDYHSHIIWSRNAQMEPEVWRLCYNKPWASVILDTLTNAVPKLQARDLKLIHECPLAHISLAGHSSRTEVSEPGQKQIPHLGQAVLLRRADVWKEGKRGKKGSTVQ